MTIHIKRIIEDCVRNDMGSAALLVCGIGEGVGKHLPEAVKCFRHAVDGNGTPHFEIERPKVIKSTNVIEMMMGIDYGIKFINTGSETLLAKIRCGIEDDARVVKLYPHGWAEPLVPGIG